jgi:hypothetical protein
MLPRRNATRIARKPKTLEQLALKILANATSYGIFIELNVEDSGSEEQSFAIYTSQGKRAVKFPKREQPGRFYHPLLGTLITGAARLMLALSERLAFDNELSWAFCDTDSMAFANIGRLPFEEFDRRVRDICKWFERLNPYERHEAAGEVSIFEMQKENFSKGKLEPLFCFAISAKRYALFNLDTQGNPVIRRASAHGLGHYTAPYGNGDENRAERGSGVRPWEEDVWKAIIVAAVSDYPKQVDYAYRPEMNEPARSQYSATRPAVLNWFRRFNEGRPYSEQVKPFNFMLSFYARRQEDLVTADAERVWDETLKDLRPVAPYTRDLAKAPARVFDRNADPAKRVPREWLRTVADVLRDYHRQPEYKSLGGGWTEAGILRRRHVLADRIDDIGKESEGWEEDEARTEEQDSVVCYPSSLPDREHMIELIKSVPKGELQLEARIARREIDAVHRGTAYVSDNDLKRMARAAERVEGRRNKSEAVKAAALDKHSGITTEAERRETEHQQRWPGGKLRIATGPMTEAQARAWEAAQTKTITPERR